MKKIFIAWKPFCTRCHNQAYHFDAKEIYIFPLQNYKKNVVVLVFRYTISMVVTLITLLREKPDVIFTINQPPFLLIVIFFYSKIFNRKYILDSHSAPFNDKKWAWFKPIYALLSKYAFLNINTNSHHKAIVECWGGRSEIMSDIPIEHKNTYRIVKFDGRTVVVVASFMFDEPLEAIWSAAKILNNVTFYVTGNQNKADEELRLNKPENVVFTGFIPMEQYFSLLVSVDAIMVLTTRNYTMQMGAYEALSLEKPIITSDWEVLRDSFGDAAVYVDNSTKSIVKGINQLYDNLDSYQANVKIQKQKRRNYYEGVKSRILATL